LRKLKSCCFLTLETALCLRKHAAYFVGIEVCSRIPLDAVMGFEFLQQNQVCIEWSIGLNCNVLQPFRIRCRLSMPQVDYHTWPPTDPAHLQMVDSIDQLGIDISSRTSVGGLGEHNICTYSVIRPEHGESSNKKINALDFGRFFFEEPAADDVLAAGAACTGICECHEV